MCRETARQAEKACHVRQFGVRIESRLVHPLGVNVENHRVAQRFVNTDADAPRLRPWSVQNQFQLLAKQMLFPRLRLEAQKGVYRQDGLP
jgi:hypothetical protein